MYAYQFSIFIILSALVINKASRSGALVVFAAFVFYISTYQSIPDSFYFSYSALLNMVAAHFLSKRNKYAATCSYLLVITNLFGYWLWYNDLNLSYYDFYCAMFLSLQVITLTPKGKPNGLRYYVKYLAANSFSVDGCKKNTVSSEKNRQSRR